MAKLGRSSVREHRRASEKPWGSERTSCVNSPMMPHIRVASPCLQSKGHGVKPQSTAQRPPGTCFHRAVNQSALQALNEAGQIKLLLRVSHDAQCTLLCALSKGRLQCFCHVCTPLERKDDRSDTVDALVC